MHGTTKSMIRPMMPLGKLKQMPQVQLGQLIDNRLPKDCKNKKVRMRKKKAAANNNSSTDPIMKHGKLIAQRLYLGLQVSMLGLKIMVINQMSVHGNQRLITSLQEMRQLGLWLNLTGHQFSMSLPKDHHQVTQKNLS